MPCMDTVVPKQKGPYGKFTDITIKPSVEREYGSVMRALAWELGDMAAIPASATGFLCELSVSQFPLCKMGIVIFPELTGVF